MHNVMEDDKAMNVELLVCVCVVCVKSAIIILKLAGPAANDVRCRQIKTTKEKFTLLL